MQNDDHSQVGHHLMFLAVASASQADAHLTTSPLFMSCASERPSLHYKPSGQPSLTAVWAARAARTTNGGLTEMLSVTVLGPGSKIEVPAGPCSLQGLWGSLCAVPFPSHSWQSLRFLGLQTGSPKVLCPPCYLASSLCVYVSSPRLPRTPVALDWGPLQFSMTPS